MPGRRRTDSRLDANRPGAAAVGDLGQRDRGVRHHAGRGGEVVELVETLEDHVGDAARVEVGDLLRVEDRDVGQAEAQDLGIVGPRGRGEQGRGEQRRGGEAGDETGHGDFSIGAPRAAAYGQRPDYAGFPQAAVRFHSGLAGFHPPVFRTGRSPVAGARRRFQPARAATVGHRALRAARGETADESEPEHRTAARVDRCRCHGRNAGVVRAGSARQDRSAG